MLEVQGRQMELSLNEARAVAVQILDGLYNTVLRNKATPRRVRVKKAE